MNLNNNQFNNLGLSKEILEIITQKGFTEPTAIQAQIIPKLLNGDKDIIGQAQTGTGKTAAFAIPLLERLDSKLSRTQAIILAPTRELVMQVAREIESFSTANAPSVLVVYGGNNIRGEIRDLRKIPQIVVGTPGRIQHHIRNKHLHLDQIKYFILDEADEMLNFGFREDIENILENTPKQRRVLLFSATMPQSIMNIVQNYMGDYDQVKIESQTMTNQNITQKYYCVHTRDKFDALCRIMEAEDKFYAIVFCRTKFDTDLIASKLAAKHLRAEAIHGDIDQSQREKILARFREGKINILVATDVAARGIDINELNFVVNYSLPETYEAYTHRIGRTGRAGNEGTAITLITRQEMRKLRFFEKNLKIRIEKGSLPSPKELIIKKEQNFLKRLENILENEDLDYLKALVKKVLERDNKDISKVIAAIIRDAYQGDFDIKKYRNIADDSLSAPSYSQRRSNYDRRPRNSNYRKANGYQGRKNFSKYKNNSQSRNSNNFRSRSNRSSNFSVSNKKSS